MEENLQVPQKQRIQNGIKIYNCTTDKTIPEWNKEYLGREKKQKKNTGYNKRVEQIQDFSYPNVCTKITMSKDGRYIGTCGQYKPRIRVYDTEQQSMKFERFTDTEVLLQRFLSDDYTKIVLLRDDKTLEFHAQYGLHERIHLPAFGRDIQYHQPTCDMYISTNTNMIYRMNMEVGSFQEPWETKLEGGCSTIELNSIYPFAVFGGAKKPLIEFWDMRDSKQSTTQNILDTIENDISYNHIYDIMNTTNNNNTSSQTNITSLSFDHTGQQLSVGTSTGHIVIYDIRSNRPLNIQDHHYNLPIQKISYIKSSNALLTCDTKVIKLWDLKDTKMKSITTIEATAKINDMCIVEDTGLLFTAIETPIIQVHYIPFLGPVPSWCDYLEALTEEIDEVDTSLKDIYTDFKFVTKDDLDLVGLTHLQGTSSLRAYVLDFTNCFFLFFIYFIFTFIYLFFIILFITFLLSNRYMHGYFIDSDIYNKSKKLYDQLNTNKSKEDYIKEKVQEKLDEKTKQSQMITTIPKSTKKENYDIESSIDPRFKSILYDKDFDIDTESKNYNNNLSPDVIKVADVIGEPISSNSSSDSDTVYKNRRKYNRQKNKLNKKLIKESKSIILPLKKTEQITDILQDNKTSQDEAKSFISMTLGDRILQTSKIPKKPIKNIQKLDKESIEKKKLERKEQRRQRLLVNRGGLASQVKRRSSRTSAS